MEAPLLERAEGLAGVGEALIAAGRSVEALQVLRRSAEAFKKLGRDADAQRVEKLIEQLSK